MDREYGWLLLTELQDVSKMENSKWWKSLLHTQRTPSPSATVLRTIAVKSCVRQDSWSLAAPPRVVCTVFYNYYVKLNVATCNKLNVCIEPCNYPFHSVHLVTEYRLCTFKSIKIQLREANIIGIEIMADRKRNKFL